MTAMRILFHPTVTALLILVFVVAGLTGGPENGAEAALMRWVTELRANQPPLTAAAAFVTQLGGAAVTLAIAGLAALWMLLRHNRGKALLLASTVIAERLLVDGLKAGIGRARPSLEPMLTHSLAYPSGHSANSMTAFLATALIATPPPYRRTATIAAILVAIFVGLTRVWLGVHWPSDVIGGWALGLLAVTAAMVLGERSGALRLEAQHDVVRRHVTAADEEKPA